MAKLDFDAVRAIGLALPNVVDGTAYGSPALKLSGKLVACVPTNKSAAADSLVVHVSLEHRHELLREQPDVYYITDHYAPHAAVLVRLAKISREDLTALLRDACRDAASPALPARRPKRAASPARRSPGRKQVRRSSE